VNYLSIVFITVPINFVTAVLTSILHAKGDTRNPMVALVIANVLNIFLDWLFIMIFGWGVKGAAAATLLGIIFTLFYLMITVMKALQTNVFHLFSRVRLTLGMLKRIMRVGIFSVLYGITRPFTGMLMFQIAAESGVAAVAAFGIGGRWFSLVFIILGGLEAAISILVGQSLGSRNMEKIKHLIKEGLTVGLLSIAVFGVLYLTFPGLLMSVFTKDQQVLAFGARYLRIVFLGLMFVPFTTVFNAAFKGAGDTMPPMIGALIANWIVKIPMAYMLSRMGMHSDGVWTAIAVSVVAEAAVTGLFFRRGNWKNKIV
jgi:putative MATE family efflux protein